MSTNKPSIPKGTRDFLPEQYSKRAYIFKTIEEIFKRYGFKPIETPAMEFLSTLTGKYGDEGDKLIFKILNSGDFLQSVPTTTYENRDNIRFIPHICEKALRYDLTVPFARFVVQHYNELSFPFKRYQIQPVWRADRPQKGRYREFYQCDIDVIGSDSLFNEAELIKITDEIFSVLGIEVVIKINNRKILAGIAEVSGIGDKLTVFTTVLDKLDKQGWEAVEQELISKEIPEEAVSRIKKLLLLKENPSEILEAVYEYVKTSETGITGVAETKEVLKYANLLGLNNKIEFDLSLARGLNYYTGAIFEVKAKFAEMGSISGGGRYDDLTGIFGLKNMSGVGISYGADRIYDVLEQLNLFPSTLSSFTEVLICHLDSDALNYCLPLLKALRQHQIATEIYPDAVKIKKQLAYADKNRIKYVVIAGSEEMSKNVYTLKDMLSSEQWEVDLYGIVERVSSESR